MYRATVAFNDLKDNNRSYEAGETYPRPGLKVSAARIKELSTDANRSGFPLIEYVPDPEPEKAPEKKTTRKKVAKDA